jgi:hypothetical protein
MPTRKLTWTGSDKSDGELSAQDLYVIFGSLVRSGVALSNVRYWIKTKGVMKPVVAELSVEIDEDLSGGAGSGEIKYDDIKLPE